MTITRFDPPERNSSFLDIAGRFLGFYNSPVETILSVATTAAAERSERSGNDSRSIFPVEVDDEAMTVNVLVPEKLPKTKGGGPGPAHLRQQLEQAETAKDKLQQVLETGVLVPGIPGFYYAVAKDIARIGQSALDRNAPAAQSPPDTQPRGQDFMGGFIPPGGMGGFSGMTPASQLALTRGGRGGGTRKRRAKRPKRAKVRRKAKTRVKRGRKARLVKGSAAAKRYMAKIRRKRR